MGRYLNRIDFVEAFLRLFHEWRYRGRAAVVAPTGQPPGGWGQPEVEGGTYPNQPWRNRPQGGSTELFLRVALWAAQVRVVGLPGWIYCLHSLRAVGFGQMGVRGCIGRVRCRARCASMICAPFGQKSGDCHCFNESCATIASGVAVPVGQHFEFYGAFGGPWLRRDQVNDSATDCVDVARTQLIHACPTPQPSDGGSGASRCGPACHWPPDPVSGRGYARYAAIVELPDCILPRQREYRTPMGQVCSKTARHPARAFIGRVDGFATSSPGVWPPVSP